MHGEKPKIKILLNTESRPGLIFGLQNLSLKTNLSSMSEMQVFIIVQVY